MISKRGEFDIYSELEDKGVNISTSKKAVLKDREIYKTTTDILEDYGGEEVRAGDIYEASDIEPNDFAKGTQLEDVYRRNYENKIGTLLSVFDNIGLIESDRDQARSYIIPEDLPNDLEWSKVREELDNYQNE